MRLRLLQAREPGDVVREEERACFAVRLGLPADDVLPYDLLSGTADADALCDGVDAVLIGGSGAFSVYDPHAWVGRFITLTGELAERLPMFASCFGFQALVVAAGGVVARDDARAEVGTFDVRTVAAADDPLFGDLPATFAAQLGHKDHAVTWPGSLRLLAASDRCPYQACRVPDRLVWATQFHPELTRDDNLRRLERYRVAYTAAFGPDGYQRMVDGFRPSPVADGLLARWRVLVAAGR